VKVNVKTPRVINLEFRRKNTQLHAPSALTPYKKVPVAMKKKVERV
jgi:hypothetical protein